MTGTDGSMKKKTAFSFKRYSSLFISLWLVLGLLISLYATKQRTNTAQKAATTAVIYDRHIGGDEFENLVLSKSLIDSTMCPAIPATPFTFGITNNPCVSPGSYDVYGFIFLDTFNRGRVQVNQNLEFKGNKPYITLTGIKKTDGSAFTYSSKIQTSSTGDFHFGNLVKGIYQLKATYTDLDGSTWDSDAGWISVPSYGLQSCTQADSFEIPLHRVIPDACDFGELPTGWQLKADAPEEFQSYHYLQRAFLPDKPQGYTGEVYLLQATSANKGITRRFETTDATADYRVSVAVKPIRGRANLTVNNGGQIYTQTANPGAWTTLSMLFPYKNTTGMTVNITSPDSLAEILFDRVLVEKVARYDTNPPDLDVLYISRTPRYDRYLVKYDFTSGAITSVTGGKWPTEGEQLTYTAHVQNMGGTSASDFTYTWKINGTAVKTGASPALKANERTTFSITAPWVRASAKLIEFGITPKTPSLDVSTKNNALRLRDHDFAFRLHVEESVYDTFRRNKNMIGTYSFEDWAQAHASALNSMITTGYAMNSLKRQNASFQPGNIFLDEIVIEKDWTLPRGEEHAPEDAPWDGRWGFETSEWKTANILSWIGRIQGTLLHEWSHQLGMTDSGMMSFDQGDALNQVNQTSFAVPWTDITNSDALRYSWFTASGYASTVGYRRGFYGEYVWDIPDRTSLYFTSLDGRPLCGAQVKLFQKAYSATQKNFIIDTIPEITGTTASDGQLPLPNRSAVPARSATGHMLISNPFGNVGTDGRNGLFLIEITYKKKKYYQWFSLSELNKLYWKGNMSILLPRIAHTTIRIAVPPADITLCAVQ